MFPSFHDRGKFEYFFHHENQSKIYIRILECQRIKSFSRNRLLTLGKKDPLKFPIPDL